jgi:2',3'-cyclic-nucleotide 2'-phosphodiesterase (5'-nucleotidase family)
MSQEDGAVLRLDAGNLLFKKPGAASPQEKAVAAGIMDIYPAMAYDAVAVGAYDLAAGVDFLKKNEKMPWLSANLRNGQGQPLFPADLVLTRGDLRIGVIGLTGAMPVNQSLVQVGDWRKSLSETADRLRPDCRLLVVLSNLSSAENVELARNYPAIDLLITADADHDNGVSPQPEEKPWMAQSMSEGKSLGVLTLFGQTAPSSAMKWEIRAANIPLKMSLPEDAAIAEMLRRIESKKTTAKADQ